MESEDKLVIVWSSGDRDVALSMVFMYALNSCLHGWWQDITFIVWGPSAKLLAEDRELEEHIRAMIEQGIKLEACITCSDMYHVSDNLRDMGIDVKRMGTVLTEYVKEGRKILTF